MILQQSLSWSVRLSDRTISELCGCVLGNTSFRSDPYSPASSCPSSFPCCIATLLSHHLMWILFLTACAAVCFFEYLMFVNGLLVFTEMLVFLWRWWRWSVKKLVILLRLPILIIEIISIFEKLNEEGRTIVMITHEEDIASSAKTSVVIKDGLIENS